MAMLADCADDEALISEFLSARQIDSASIASMIIKSRVSPKYLQEKTEDLQEAFGIEFTDQWQDYCTDQLPMQVVEELVEFVSNERRRWKKLEEEGEVATEEVGKAGNDSPQQPSEPEPIGMISTGESNSAPSTTIDSTEKTLVSSPST